MRIVQAVAVAALVSVLSVIAYDLHRLADAADFLMSRGRYTQNLTPAQRDKLTQLQLQQAIHDFDVMMATPDPARAKAAKK
jgi:hypothetical protein